MRAAVGQLVLGTGFLPEASAADVSLSQWDMKPDAASKLVEFAGVHRGDLVIEPSAGKGNLVAALRRAGARVVMVEVDAARVRHLERRFAADCNACPIHHADFLDFAARLSAVKRTDEEALDLAVMNPPYEDNQALLHIVAALSIAPRAVVEAPLALLETARRFDMLWSQHTLANVAVLKERQKHEGAEDDSPMTPMAFFDIRRGPGRSIVQWM